jgi:Tfp pilus assembly protein PilP
MKLINSIVFALTMILVAEGCSKKSASVPAAPVKSANDSASPMQPKMAVTTAGNSSVRTASPANNVRPNASTTPAMSITSGVVNANISTNKPVVAMTDRMNPTTLSNGLVKPQDVQPVYSYISEGRKDPFATYLQGSNSKKANKTSIPLLNYPLADLRLVAVIIVKKHQFLAMIQTPDSKGYVVKPGAEIGINHGRIHEITDHSISVEEEFTEIGGEKKKRTIVLSLHPPEEGQL